MTSAIFSHTAQPLRPRGARMPTTVTLLYPGRYSLQTIEIPPVASVKSRKNACETSGS